MHSGYLRGAAITVLLLGSFAAAEKNGMAQQPSPMVPGSMSTGQPSAGAEGEAVPGFLFRGHLRLTAEQRRQIWQSIQQTNAEQQPVPRAFAPAVGMTAPPELKLTSLPPALHGIPGVEKHHQFAVLETGVALIVGEDRFVAAMIQSAEGKRDGASPAPSSAPAAGR